jgi:MscS family membrane protein
VVSVPNGQIANMTLENFSSRDKFLFHPVLALRYGTTSQQMSAVLEGIRSLLEESQHLETASIRVRFLRLGPSSLDVEIFTYVLAADWNQFLKIQESILLRIMELVESSGVQLAIPSQSLLVISPASHDDADQALFNANKPDDKPTNHAAIAKSA